MDPRLHARRVSVIRAQGRRRLRLLLAPIAVLSVVSAAVGAALSPLLDVDRVRVHGVTGPRAAEVRAATDVTSGEPLLFLDLGGVAERVERLRWVERADVARHLPDTLTITVVERAPVAWAAAADGTIELVDRRGAVLATAAAPPPGVPQLGYTSPADRAAAARVTRALPRAFRPGVVAVVATDGQVVLGLASGVAVRLGAPTLLEAKVRAVEAVLVALGGEPVAYIDVRVPSAPVTG
jgi:cell division protein FtsQ